MRLLAWLERNWPVSWFTSLLHLFTDRWLPCLGWTFAWRAVHFEWDKLVLRLVVVALRRLLQTVGICDSTTAGIRDRIIIIRGICWIPLLSIVGLSYGHIQWFRRLFVCVESCNRVQLLLETWVKQIAIVFIDMLRSKIYCNFKVTRAIKFGVPSQLVSADLRSFFRN